MWIWEGIDLLGCVSGIKKGIRNNVTYTVVRIDHDSVVVKGEDEIRLTFAQVQQLCRLSFCRTYASIQGTEYDTECKLHCTNNRHFTMKHLFVALSRCKDRKMIDVT